MSNSNHEVVSDGKIKIDTNYYFQIGDLKYFLGMKLSDLKDFRFAFYGKKRLKPKKTTLVRVINNKTKEELDVIVINTGTKTCSIKDAVIYEIVVNLRLECNKNIKIFTTTNKNSYISYGTSIDETLLILGTPTQVVDKEYVTTTEEDTVEYEEEVEHVVEWDDLVGYYYTKETNDYTVTYEKEETLDAYNVWEKDDVIITAAHDVLVNKVAITKKLSQDLIYVEPVVISRIKRVILITRSVCCFTSILSLLALAGFVFGKFDIIYAISAVLLGLGWLSALIACPIHLIKVCFSVIGNLFAFGGSLVLLLGVVTGFIGIVVAIALALFGASIITIPYYFKNLKNKLITINNRLGV